MQRTAVLSAKRSLRQNAANGCSEPNADIANRRICYRETKGSNAYWLLVPILASVAVAQSFCTVARSS